jgi:hypothetical protein
MRRNGGRLGGRAAVPALGLAVLLGGCTWFDNASYAVTDGISNTGARFGAPWGGMRATASPDESVTIQRVRGVASAETGTLQAEPGNVWPEEEAPRATLANPDAALRGIPAYRPSDPRPVESGRGGIGPEPLASRGAPGRLRGSSTPPPAPTPLFPEQPQSTAPLPNTRDSLAPPPPRVEGQTVLTPQGPVVTGAGTERTGTFLTPGGGVGVITRDGPNVTTTGPDGRVQTFPAPR